MIIFSIFDSVLNTLSIPAGYQQLYNIFTLLFGSLTIKITIFSFLIFEVSLNLNYLYIFIVVVYKSYRDRKRLENINDYIRPIVKKYHDRYYNNRYTNYA